MSRLSWKNVEKNNNISKTMNLKTTLKVLADSLKNAQFPDLSPIVSPGSRPCGHPVEAVRQGVPIIKSDAVTDIYFSKRRLTENFLLK
jgi:hypothetical protein